ncbi:MAG TPA: GrpB family protein [Gemmatimonas sp.]|nr:GrpB family protein [Gemmatimonas sp.]
MPRVIEVVAYDPEWITAFLAEAQQLRAIFYTRALAIEHIGSTAVPGMHAKPIIDVLVVLDSTDDIATFSPAMVALGYQVRGECLDAEIPGTRGRFYFTKDCAAVRTHQVHVCRVGHPQLPDLLAFRDYLRAHPSVARAYEAVKQRAATEHRDTIVGYMRHKAAFMTETIGAARRWAACNSSGHLRRDGPSCE